jgi:hypothetical protein
VRELDFFIDGGADGFTITDQEPLREGIDEFSLLPLIQ